jgi:hypothetical protein
MRDPRIRPEREHRTHFDTLRDALLPSQMLGYKFPASLVPVV